MPKYLLNPRQQTRLYFLLRKQIKIHGDAVTNLERKSRATREIKLFECVQERIKVFSFGCKRFKMHTLGIHTEQE